MNYSFRHLNERGITQRSEFLAMASDADAIEHARLDTPRAGFVVEVWRGDTLLSRIPREREHSDLKEGRDAVGRARI